MSEQVHSARRGAVLTPFAGFGPLPPLTRFSLWGDLARLADALAPARLPVSQVACRALEAEACAALWLGPDEQLLLAGEHDSARLADSLRMSLADVPHSLTDISHRQTAFEVTGPNACTLLSTGCPLDLGEAAFPRGMCTRTLFEKVEIVLWRKAADSFHIEVWRSFAPHVTRLLAQAAGELVA